MLIFLIQPSNNVRIYQNTQSEWMEMGKGHFYTISIVTLSYHASEHI